MQSGPGRLSLTCWRPTEWQRCLLSTVQRHYSPAQCRLFFGHDRFIRAGERSVRRCVDRISCTVGCNVCQALQ